MALKKCKECGSEISKKAKACPNCGAPQGPKQRSLGKLIVLLIFGGFMYAMFTGDSSTYTATTKQEEMQQLFISGKEPTVKDALWTAEGIFKVGVIDDGTPRDGYASYVCQVLYEHGFKGKKVWVHVLDMVKLTQNNEWVKLGDARCQ